MDCGSYTRYADFRLRVIEPAIKEINKYSDIHINFDAEKEGKRVHIITFYMTEKTIDERLEAQKAGLTALDGKIHYWDSKHTE
jgi:plasmid replication initiation protein